MFAGADDIGRQGCAAYDFEDLGVVHVAFAQWGVVVAFDCDDPAAGFARVFAEQAKFVATGCVVGVKEGDADAFFHSFALQQYAPGAGVVDGRAGTEVEAFDAASCVGAEAFEAGLDDFGGVDDHEIACVEEMGEIADAQMFEV